MRRCSPCRCYENPIRGPPEWPFGRPRTRTLAIAVWVRRSSVDHRIATHGSCHLHDRPTHDHPAVQSISRRDPAASLRARCVVRGPPRKTAHALPHFRTRGGRLPAVTSRPPARSTCCGRGPELCADTGANDAGSVSAGRSAWDPEHLLVADREPRHALTGTATSRAG